MDARETVETYYDALRDGRPLGPFFAGVDADDADTVKFGISERLVGIDEIEAGLAEQTQTTADWTVESRALRVTERERHAWFSDDVAMAWTAGESGSRRAFETRWSGTLERRADGTGGDPGGGPNDGEVADDRPDWQFVGMHVSTAGEV